jgi:3-dehydro-L-gulonate 2-dehydrogenase
MGYWKGSGFAVLLDMISALISGGFTTAGIDKANKGSGGSSNQVFIAINPRKINPQEFIDNALNETIAQIKSAVPAKEKGEIFFPGENPEQSVKTRKENMELGIPVDDKVWEKVKALAGF